MIQAKVWYLTSVKYYPLYGSTFFYVHYKGFWSYPNHLIVAVDLAGVKFVNQKSKQVRNVHVLRTFTQPLGASLHIVCGIRVAV